MEQWRERMTTVGCPVADGSELDEIVETIKKNGVSVKGISVVLHFDKEEVRNVDLLSLLPSPRRRPQQQVPGDD